MDNTSKNYDKYKQIILSATQYGGDSSVEKKSISASELNNDILKLYYRYKNGIQRQDEVEINTIGSLVHLAIETIIRSIDINNEILTEHSMAHAFDNDWKLTATADIIDKETETILDIKLTKYMSGKIKSSTRLLDKEDSRIIQLSVQRYLYWKETGKIFSAGILFLYRDAGLDFTRGTENPAYDIVLVDDYLYSFKEVEKMFLGKVNELTKFLESNKIPDICNDLMFRKLDGKTIKMACKFCAYKSQCDKDHGKRTSLGSILGSIL